MIEFEYTTPEIEIRLFSTEAIMYKSDIDPDDTGFVIDETTIAPIFSYSNFTY